MDDIHTDLWEEPATFVTAASSERRAIWASVISTLLLAAVTIAIVLMLNWMGVPLPATDKFDDAARTD